MGPNTFELIHIEYVLNPTQRVILQILVIISIYLISVGIIRTIGFIKKKRQLRNLMEILADFLTDGKFDEAIAIASKKKYRKNFLATIVLATLKDLKAFERKQVPFKIQIEITKRAIEREEIKYKVELEKGLDRLDTIGTIGSLLGIFGTISGVIYTFQGFHLSTADVIYLNYFLSETFIPAGIGIFVSIVAIFLYNKILNKVDIFFSELKCISSELIDCIAKNRYRILK